MVEFFSIIMAILFYLFWPLAIIGGIIYFIRRRMRGSAEIDREWHDKIFFSKEDFVSQFFFLFSIILFNLAFWTINYQIGQPVSGITIFLISTLLGVAIGCYFKIIWTFVLSTFGLAAWWFYQAAIWIADPSIYTELKPIVPAYMPRSIETIKPIVLIAAFIFIVMIFYLFGRMLERKIQYKRLAKIYSFLGLIALTGALFIFSTSSGIKMIGEGTKGILFFYSPQIAISIIVFLGALIAMLVYSFKEKLIFFYEAIAIGLIAFLFLIFTLIPEQAIYAVSSPNYYFNRDLSWTGIFWAIFFNILLFFEILGIVFLGYLRRKNYLINLGAASLFVFVFVKYFDWFGETYSSAFLIGAGILLFVVGWLMERGRRYMIAKIGSAEVKQI